VSLSWYVQFYTKQPDRRQVLGSVAAIPTEFLRDVIEIEVGIEMNAGRSWIFCAISYFNAVRAGALNNNATRLSIILRSGT
jgi:hypothetical protein